MRRAKAYSSFGSVVAYALSDEIKIIDLRRAWRSL